MPVDYEHLFTVCCCVLVVSAMNVLQVHSPHLASLSSAAATLRSDHTELGRNDLRPISLDLGLDGAQPQLQSQYLMPEEVLNRQQEQADLRDSRQPESPGELLRG